MSLSTSGVSLSDLSADGVVLSHEDAVAIAREAVLKASRGELSHIPAPDDLRLGADGRIFVASHLPAAASDIRRAARLLTAVLAHASPDASAPSTFRLILARAFAEDAAAYRSVEDFTDALAPFAADDPTAAVRRAVAAWENRHARPETNQLSAPITTVASEPASEPELVRIPAVHQADAEAPHARTQPALARPAASPAFARTSRSRASAVLAALVLVLALGATVWFVRSGDESRGDVQAHVDALAVPETPKTTPPVAPPERAAVPAQPAVIPPPAPSRTAAAPPAPTRIEEPRRRPAPAPPISRSVPDRPTVRSESAPPQPVSPTDAFSPAVASPTSGAFDGSASGSGAEAAGGVLKVTRITGDRGSNFHPRPSPDGRLIAFDSDRDGERGVYVAGSDGRGVRRVSGGGFAAVPSWSPDGRRLAFVRAEENDPRVWNIWTVDVASGRTQRVTAHGSGRPWGASWFADGQRIAYGQEDRLVVRALDGRSTRVYESPVRGRQVRSPAVSPDGRRIIFQVRRDGAWMLDLESGAMHRVLEDPSVEDFSWSRDGRRVAYHSRQSGTWGVWMAAPR